MYISKSFIPILKNNPSEAKIKSHQLMLRVGMIKQSSSGIYSWLPLGLKVMKKIEQIVRHEQDKIGAQEILMPTIQSSDIWKESGRYEDYGDEMLRIKDRQNREMLYGPTNEELVTDIFRTSVKSYKSLPQLLYHIQWKFRDEIRPRFGIMRCREFFMKDAYSFDISDEDAIFSYNKFFLSYLKTFKRLELVAIPMAADTGPIGGNLSHEFIILAETGESKIFTDKRIFDLEYDDTKLEKKSLENLMNDLAGRGTYERQERPNYDDGTTATPPLNPAALYKIGEGLDIFNLLEKVIEENMDVDDALEEVSSMAGGNVAISVGKEDKKGKRKPTIFREDEELEEDRGIRGEPGSNYPSARDADDRTNEVDPETGKSGNVGPKFKIAKEQSEVEEIANYLLEAGVFIG